MSQGIKIRVFHINDSERVIELISDIIVNKFNFKLEFNTLDSEIVSIEENYNNSDGGCFWVAESIDDNDTQQQKIVGTAAVRNLKQFESTCELKRMYVLNEFRLHIQLLYLYQRLWQVIIYYLIQLLLFV